MHEIVGTESCGNSADGNASYLLRDVHYLIRQLTLGFHCNSTQTKWQSLLFLISSVFNALRINTRLHTNMRSMI